MTFKLFIPSILHLLVDFFSIYLLNSFNYDLNTSIIFIAAYDILAFLTQPFLGALIEKNKHPETLMTISGLSLFLAIFIPNKIIVLILIGLSNSLFHVSAGKLVIEKANKTSPLGIFISFGSLGVYFGTAFSDIYFLTLMASIFALLILINQFMHYETISYSFSKDQGSYKTLLFPLVLISIGVILRGFLGTYTNFTWTSSVSESALFITLAIFFGKFIGGFLIDWFGSTPLILVSTILSFISMFFDNIYFSLIGIFAINLMMALTLDLVRKAMPRFTAFGFGILAASLLLGTILAIVFRNQLTYNNYINKILAIINGLILIWSLFILKRER